LVSVPLASTTEIACAAPDFGAARHWQHLLDWARFVNAPLTEYGTRCALVIPILMMHRVVSGVSRTVA